MLSYVAECRQTYIKGNEVEYVECVIKGAMKHERNEKVVRRGTKALLQLSKAQGRDAFISRKQINLQAGFKHYHRTGLYVWLKGEADVVEKAKGQTAYRIRDEFYRAIDEAVSKYRLQTRQTGI